MFGLVGVALADGFINGFDAKYHYDDWRPITAIRNGDGDGNPKTQGEANWTPHCATSPVADYPSTHSVLGAAAAEVLARYFGDATPFEIDRLSLPGVVRSFASFSQAARRTPSRASTAGSTGAAASTPASSRAAASAATCSSTHCTACNLYVTSQSRA